jgi:DNA-binding beta-propeller fold protein YncE
MSIWLSVVLLGTLLGYSAASPRLSKDAAKEIDGLISELLDKYQAPANPRDGHLQQLSQIEGDSHEDLFGLAHLGNRIYVIEDGSNVIQVYDDNTLAKVDSITVHGLQHPGDLTACEQSRQLFVLDRHPVNALWQVDAATHEAKKLKPINSDADQAVTLSASNGHVVLTSKFNSKLFVFNVESGDVKTITLPRAITARHAVETSRGTFFVSHVGSRGSFGNDGVSEFDSTGTQLNTYGGERGSGSNQLNKPIYLALIPDGGVLVADFENKRVVGINDDLTLGEVVITTEDLLSRQSGDDGSKAGRPWRLCISENGDQLFVGLSTGDIQVYRV